MTSYKNQSGFTAVVGLLSILVIAVIGFGGYYVGHTQKTSGVAVSTPTAKQTETAKNDVAPTPKQTAKVFLTVTEWGIKIPVSGELSALKYVDITQAYGFTDSTMQFLINNGTNNGPCKGGMIDWVQRVPTSASTTDHKVLAKIGNYNYIDYGVQDCGSDDPTGIVGKFKEAAAQMVTASN